MLVDIDHIQFAMPVGGEAAARAFYVGVLGLTEEPKPEELAKRGGAWFRAGGVRIHLGAEADFRAPSQKAHGAFVVDDLEAVLTACALAAATVTRDPVRVEGRARGYVHDPFGNRLELIQQRIDN